MVVTTPGVDLIVQKAAFPALLNYVILYLSLFLSRRHELVPTWALVLTAVLVIPSRVFARLAYEKWRHQQQAERLGARLTPIVVSGSVGNYALLRTLKEIWERGYPGEFLAVRNVFIAFVDWLLLLSPVYHE